jgi:hypothetical protein
VDREAEVALLQQGILDAGRGIGRAFCITGAAGIGKTRLATESLRMAREAGFRCAWGAGWAEPGVPPLWPWQSVLFQLECAPRIGPIEHQSEQERFTTFRTIADAVTAVAAERPVLVVLDDLHTCDPASLLLTRLLVRTSRAASLHLLTTSRDTDGPSPALDALVRDCQVLDLAPLSRTGLRELHRQLGRRIPQEDLTDLHELTGGIPLYVREVLHGAGSSMAVTPDSVQAVLRLRLHGLPHETREVLAAAAVLGPLASRATVLAVVARSGGDPAGGARWVALAEQAGVLAPPDGDRLVFTHRLLADASLALLAPRQLARLHERVADVLEGIDATAIEHVVAVAHHRLAAARHTHRPDDIARAGAACSVAAQALTGGLAYEAAAQLAQRAVELHDAHGPATPVPLVLEVARAELASGNLLGAREWFRRVAASADDPVQLAHAALGLGGIWVHEHRSAADHAAFMALLDRARAWLGADHPALSLRLDVRAVAERAYVGDADAAAVREAVVAARRLGDPAALAEALSLWHHTMLGPANTDARRLRVADELVAVAAAAGHELLGLMGLLWRAVDLLLLGDARAGRALTEVRERADALQVRAVLFVLDAIDVMRDLRAGRIGEAEQAAQRCFQLGLAIGDADAVGYYGAHLLTIRWLQLRPDEILPLARGVAASPTLVDGDVAHLAATAVLGALAGRHEDATADLRVVVSCVPRDERVSSNFLVTLFCAAEAALALGDRKAAEIVYDSLLPFRHLPIMASLGVVCLGSAERSLALAAMTLGEVNLAVHHLELALEANRRLQNRLMATIAEGELGCALIERGAPGDVERGVVHVAAARAALAELGLVERELGLAAESARRLRQAPVPDGHMVRTASGWRLGYADHAVELADSIGARRLIHLLRHPGLDVPAVQLLGVTASCGPQQDVADRASLRAYRARIAELRSEIDAADDDHDLERSAALRGELEVVLDHVTTATGLRGRSRSFVDPGERARVAVRKSLARVFDAIARQDAGLAAAVQQSLRTGAVCRFEPIERFPSVWREGSLV